MIFIIVMMYFSNFAWIYCKVVIEKKTTFDSYLSLSNVFAPWRIRYMNLKSLLFKNPKKCWLIENISIVSSQVYLWIVKIIEVSLFGSPNKSQSQLKARYLLKSNHFIKKHLKIIRHNQFELYRRAFHMNGRRNTSTCPKCP